MISKESLEPSLPNGGEKSVESFLNSERVLIAVRQVMERARVDFDTAITAVHQGLLSGNLQDEDLDDPIILFTPIQE